MFAGKLDFLMKVTDTSNSTLARALSFDSSYISKIRRGVRNCPSDKDFEEKTAAFIARRINDPDTLRAVTEVVSPGIALPSDPDSRAGIIAEWLRSTSVTGKADLTDFFSELSHISIDNPSMRTTDAVSREHKYKEKNCLVFYGNEGKRDSVIYFLQKILNEYNGTEPLLLFSNENMNWMLESHKFASEWQDLLIRILRKGIRIRIIHTVRRNLNDMMGAIRKWLPLYISGNIEPYYCPMLRDNIYKRSLFVASGLIALTSTSIGEDTDGMGNILFEDKKTVSAYEREYLNYLSYCKPLMKIYGNLTGKEFISVMNDIFNTSGSIQIAGSNPLFLLIPDKYLKSIPSDITDGIKDLRGRYLDLLGKGITVKELFTAPSEGLKEANIWPGIKIEYTEETQKDHFKAVKDLIERYPNYEPFIGTVDFDRIVIFVAEYEKVVVMTSAPAVFEIYEENICAAITEYINRLPTKGNRCEIIKILEQI